MGWANILGVVAMDTRFAVKLAQLTNSIDVIFYLILHSNLKNQFYAATDYSILCPF
jgi:hypothetical protein